MFILYLLIVFFSSVEFSWVILSILVMLDILFADKRRKEEEAGA